MFWVSQVWQELTCQETMTLHYRIGMNFEACKYIAPAKLQLQPCNSPDRYIAFCQKECELLQRILCYINNADKETSLKFDRLDRHSNRLSRKVKAFINQKYEYIP